MSILSRYLLRLHFVPFAFALSALTGVMLVNQIARRFPDLVGKGLPAGVIIEVFALSIPFLLAMTLPMAVLVSILYTMSRLTAENELTAMRAGGVSLGGINLPLLAAGITMAALTFLFSDQILPRTNHRLRALLQDIGQTKPTFAIEEQVINEVRRSQLYLRAGRVDQSTFLMQDVSIFDLTDGARKRVTYADSAYMGFGDDQEDLYLTLYNGRTHESDDARETVFQVVEFDKNVVRIEDVASSFSRTINSGYRGDREMSTCQMDSVVAAARSDEAVVTRRAASVELNSLRGLVGLRPMPVDTIGLPHTPSFYCRTLLPAIVSLISRRDTEDSTSTTAESESGNVREPQLEIPLVGDTSIPEMRSLPRRALQTPSAVPRIGSALVLRDRVRSAEIRQAAFLVEIHKKYSIAFACIVFVIVGVPAAIRFAQAGVGLVIGMSLGVFGIFYVGLIAGESLANKLIVPPFWAMWVPNIAFVTIGMFALWRIRTTSSSTRSGGFFRFRRTPRVTA